MNLRWEAGRALDQTPTRSPRRPLYVITLFGASAVAVGLAPSRPALATLIIACLVAVVATSHVAASTEQRTAAGRSIPASRFKPAAARDLNLTGESPTERSDLTVLAGAFPSATRRRPSSGHRPGRRAVLLGAVVLAVIGWLAVSFDQSAVWTVLTRVAVATAALPVVVGMAIKRSGADRHDVEIGRNFIYSNVTTRVSLDDCVEDTRATVRRSR